LLDHNVHEGKRRPKERIKSREEGREERIIEGEEGRMGQCYCYTIRIHISKDVAPL
jgi:hypothetical protein